jgi:uncharacterized protein (DUF2236 family)
MKRVVLTEEAFRAACEMAKQLGCTRAAAVSAAVIDHARTLAARERVRRSHAVVEGMKEVRRRAEAETPDRFPPQPVATGSSSS